MKPLALADNGDAFGSTSLVGGIVMSPPYPIGVWLKNLGSTISAVDIYGCRYPPWMHRCGNLLPLLVYVACVNGVRSVV